MNARQLVDELMATEQLMADLAADYPLGLRVLPDGSIAALCELLTTRSVILGIDRWGWSRRFCFKDRELATRRFAELVSEDDEPEGYIARRPQ